MKLTRAVLILSLLITSAPFAQTSAGDKCRLEGQVVNSFSGLPVRKAAVTLFEVSGGDAAAASRHSAQEQGSQEGVVALTDAEGHFAFSGLEPGSYGLRAERAGFRAQSYGIPWTAGSGEPVKLAAGDSKLGVVIKLMPLGVIAGRVVDEEGDPIRQVSVSVHAYVPTMDGYKLEPRANGYTNDLGEYRIFDLLPGKYFLKAVPMGARQFGNAQVKKKDVFLTAFYPGSPNESGAQQLEMMPGRQLQGVDVTLRKGHSTTLRGRVLFPEGAMNVNVIMVQHHEGGSTLSSFNANADGSFHMQGLDPGDYVVGATCVVDGKQYQVHMPLIVGTSDITDLELRPMRPLSLTGKLLIEGTTSEKLSKIIVTLDAKLGFGEASGNVHEDGTFSLRDVPHDVYAVRLENIPGMFVKAVQLGRTNVSESGLDLTNVSGDAEISVVVSTNVATVEGTVLNEKGNPAGYALVALVVEKAALNSNAKRDRRPRATENTGADGHFAFKDLAPGSYRVYAWQRTDGDSGRADPEFFKANESKSASVDVAESEHKTIQLKLITRGQDEQ